MTTKGKALALNGMHTAGIFSDMSFDGPEIGTLVLVIDRAKNLPNRKTIGKQDPYCAARLGKEAKKTTTDIRGGQTPRWDQELRFTVHDSPDYYQIKISVFNDDKKTELIGEAWIDLRDIIVPGGGQSDRWHQLGYRGKYAGEVRIEITYYDSRPKPEKPAARPKPATPTEIEANPMAAMTGPRSVPKRRPLPSDPVMGKPPAPSQPVPEQVETPPRPHANSAPAPHQQAEYNPAPAPGHQPYQQPDQAKELGAPSRRADAPSQQLYRTPERHEPYAAHHNQNYNSPHRQQPGPDRCEPYDIPQISDRGAADDERPPPPPVHRSRAGSNPPMSNAFQATPPSMRQDVLRSEAHRNSVSASYPGRPTYKAVDSVPAALPGSQYANIDQGPPGRSYTYDSPYEPHRTMQATVEEALESPESATRRASGRWPQQQPQPQSQSQLHVNPEYGMDASPAPLNFSGRGAGESARYPAEPRYQVNPNGYSAAAPEIPQRESPGYAPNFGRHSEPSLSLQSSNPDQGLTTYRDDVDDRANGYSVPPVPASLVPGMDPNIAKEASERMNQERRQLSQIRGASQQAMVDMPPRGRSMNDRYGNDLPSTAYNASATQNRSPAVYTNGPSTSSVNVAIKSRAYSPNPLRDPSPNRHPKQTIRRKSISPRPPVESERRLSGVPFGPDSYDALNPNASSAAFKDATSSRPDYREETGKIISHDGREIDPSDHLPMETWAPEPEPKQPTSTATGPSRASPPGPQAGPSSGRRPLRITARPHSMLPTSGSPSSAVTFSGGITDHAESVTSSQAVSSSTGRNRLQKKAPYRQSTSTFTPVMSGANGPGPGPGPVSSAIRKSNSGEALYQDTSRTSPRPGGIPRASTYDYVIDSGATDSHGLPHDSHGTSGVYGTSPGSQRDLHGRSHSRGRSPARGYERGYDGSGPYQYSRSAGSTNGFSAPKSTSAAPPPIPAKVPLALPPASSSSPSSSAALLGSSPGSGSGMSGALQLHSSSAARRAGSGMDDGGGYAAYGHHRQDGYGYGGHGGGGSGGGGGGALSLEEELRQIDIGTGRSSRKYNAAGYGAGGRQAYGTVYGHGGY
ncbi:hypothetical protein VTH06DRAFT_4557 [Thermothelomyces fergusii]